MVSKDMSPRKIVTDNLSQLLLVMGHTPSRTHFKKGVFVELPQNEIQSTSTSMSMRVM